MTHLRIGMTVRKTRETYKDRYNDRNKTDAWTGTIKNQENDDQEDEKSYKDRYNNKYKDKCEDRNQTGIKTGTISSLRKE